MEVLRSENEKLISKNEDSTLKLGAIEKEFLEFKVQFSARFVMFISYFQNKAHFVLEKKGKQDDESRKIADELEKAKGTIAELELQVDQTRQEHLKTVDNLATSRDNVEALEKQLKLTKSELAEMERTHTFA